MISFSKYFTTLFDSSEENVTDDLGTATKEIRVELVHPQPEGMKEFARHCEGIATVEAHQFRCHPPAPLRDCITNQGLSMETFVRTFLSNPVVAKVIPSLSKLDSGSGGLDISVISQFVALGEMANLVFDGPCHPQIFPRAISSDDDALRMAQLLFEDISNGHHSKTITWRINNGWAENAYSCIYFWIYPPENRITILFYSDGS